MRVGGGGGGVGGGEAYFALRISIVEELINAYTLPSTPSYKSSQTYSSLRYAIRSLLSLTICSAVSRTPK